MTLVKIRHAQFQYYRQVGTKTHKQTGEEIPDLAVRFARHGEVIDVSDDDLERGEAQGAFEDEAVEEEASAESEESDDNEVIEEEVSWRHDDLVVWIRDDQPTAREVVSAAGKDPENAKKLMAAEEEASGGQPRKSVMDPLRKIAGV
jgi:hypothetical protein